jgi:hypothetical protein
MKRNLRTLFIATFCLFFTQIIFAGDGSLKTASPFSVHFMTTLKAADKTFIPAVGKEARSFKICSCQILDLKSSNYDHRHLAIFAEKTNNGDLSAGHSIAKNVIEKEKKHLKEMFYDQLKVVNRVSESGDCQSLYSKLKLNDQSLVIYDILDADIRESK